MPSRLFLPCPRAILIRLPEIPSATKGNHPPSRTEAIRMTLKIGMVLLKKMNPYQEDPMTKGIKRELSLEEEIIELDRTLLASLRRNLSLAERMGKGASDEQGRVLLERHVSKHVLNVRKSQEPAPEVSAMDVEANKRIRRFDRYLAALPDSDLESVLDLVKSMYRSRKAPGSGKAKPRINPESDKLKGESSEGTKSV
jgi:hypothetical protein